MNSSPASLQSKIAIITGASSGIGKAIADLMVSEGAIIVNADINEPVPLPVSANYHFFKTDVRDGKAIDNLYRFVNEKVGKPSVLICNAGRGIHEKLSEGDPEKWKNVIDINLMGTLRILRSFLPDILAGKNGDIVFISSVSAKNVYEYGGIYSATKAAIDTIAETLRLEVKDAARVTVISPGVVDSPFFQNLESGNLDVETIGMGALFAEDIASAVIFALTMDPKKAVNNIVIRPANQQF